MKFILLTVISLFIVVYFYSFIIIIFYYSFAAPFTSLRTLTSEISFSTCPYESNFSSIISAHDLLHRRPRYKRAYPS